MIPQMPNRKIFVFPHFFDVHIPYNAMSPYNRFFDPDYHVQVTGSIEDSRIFNGNSKLERTYYDRDVFHMKALYDSGIRQVDKFVGDALRCLSDAGKLTDSVIIITADHGENFGEFGSYFEYGMQLTEGSLKILYIVMTSDKKNRIRYFSAALEDLTPTILSLAMHG